MKYCTILLLSWALAAHIFYGCAENHGDTNLPTSIDTIPKNIHSVFTSGDQKDRCELIQTVNGIVVMKSISNVQTSGDSTEEIYYYSNEGRIVYYEKHINNLIIENTIVSSQCSNYNSGKLLFDAHCKDCHLFKDFDETSLVDSISFINSFKRTNTNGEHPHSKNSFPLYKLTKQDIISIILFLDQKVVQ